MSRRHRKSPKPKRVADALIVVHPGPGVVDKASRAVADAREVAMAKRTVERALIKIGMNKRQACITVAGMTHADLLAEAERVRAGSEPEPSKRPLWRRLFGGDA